MEVINLIILLLLLLLLLLEPRGNTYRLGASQEEFNEGSKGYGGLLIQSQEEINAIKINNSIKRKKNKKF